ncbi:YgjP-like metallopeptidase domain-containing protein [Aliidiomarina quisquiliarum]|uniref:YgjP-like metallopeptidase domain-containing protein n=1 Tax=Aliidiomarina quisquiliarum TaxID=2938947 RepID=UPI00208ECC93|nr:YgjP-like metallopeptidase domain-containing protein [Aliidiomarina quisquiliarum]MCO4320984.1 M48 family metallopeptidase [Aliidiomarina quisquiliarum]
MMAVGKTPEYRDGNGFIAEVIRTNRRKSADIRVEEGAVSIVVPVSTSVEKIDQLLLNKRRWIREKIALQRDMAPPSSKEFVSGEAFPYLGRNYRLKVEIGPFAPVKLRHGRLVARVAARKFSRVKFHVGYALHGVRCVAGHACPTRYSGSAY